MAQSKSLVALHHICSQLQLETGIPLGKEKKRFLMGNAQEKDIFAVVFFHLLLKKKKKTGKSFFFQQ